MRKVNVVFLQNSPTQPRCHKRYRAFARAGIKGLVYSFNRNLYNVNLPDDITINLLGDIKSGSYVTRLIYYIKRLRPILKTYNNSVFYCYGQDIAFVAMLFGKKYIYEESDIIYLMSHNILIRKCMRLLDLLIQKRSLATVLTSQGFVQYLYNEKPSNVFVLPNKLDAFFENRSRPSSRSFNINALRFAFIGLLRSPGTMFPFIKVMAEVSSSHRFDIWGDSSQEFVEEIKNICSQYPQVSYHGPFRNPKDLEMIYSQVDINFVCYDTTGKGNECIAEPNKLYESIFFNTPIMVSPDTYLANVVSEKNTGFVVNCFSEDEIKKFLCNLSEGVIMEKIEACRNVPQSFIIDNENDIIPLLKML